MVHVRLAPLAFALLLGAAAPPPASGPGAPAVTVVRAVRGTIVDTAALTGTLVAREEVMVSPQDDGLALTEIRAEEGDHVAAGQILARLSRDVLDASLAQNAAQAARADAAAAQARSSILEAVANHTQADLALARTRDLFAKGDASREVLEQRQAAATGAAARQALAENALRASEADRQLAEAQRRELSVRLARTDIASPVAGIVSRRTARLGAVVSTNGDPLFRIIQDGVVELEADVPETLLARLHAGQKATVDAAAGARPGHVRLVSPEVGRASRLGRVRVAVDDPTGLPVGGFARATVELARHDGVLAPLSAVLFQPDGAVVQVVRDGVVETRRVTVGLRDATRAELSGIAEGEAVVAVSGTFIRGGDRVSAIE